MLVSCLLSEGGNQSLVTGLIGRQDVTACLDARNPLITRGFPERADTIQLGINTDGEIATIDSSGDVRLLLTNGELVVSCNA